MDARLGRGGGSVRETGLLLSLGAKGLDRADRREELAAHAVQAVHGALETAVARAAQPHV